MSPVQFPKHLLPAEPYVGLLNKERQKATFNPVKMMDYIYGQNYLQKRERILNILQNDPVLGDKSHRYYNGRDIRFKKSLAGARRFAELTKLHKWDDEEYGIADFLIDESSAFRLHRSMFIPTLSNQGTPEQKHKYLDPALKYEIIGCYAQTELGHGSNVRALETTATYHPESQTFVLHSPTLTAAKWWIGGLGVAANHAIVMARLITQNKDYGPHPFIVQIRDLVDHTPLKGITVGDIGPKFGFNTVDNGFILFDNMTIPHIAMLARYSSVDKVTGEYITPPNSKLAYGTMVFVRANIVLESRFVLARAATVAIRYSAVRLQGSDNSNLNKITHNGVTKTVETPILDYSMQQYKLFPVIAQAFACHFTGQEMHRMYAMNQERMAQGDFSYLADLHATSSGLKSLTTTLAVAAIEDCRRACGGHGYSLFSGLGLFYQDYLPKATWEGDNFLLTQQTARYLMKTYRSVQAGKLKSENTSFSSNYLYEYLSNSNAHSSIDSVSDLNNPETLISAFKYRAGFLIEKAVHAIDIKQTPWNDMLIDIYKISRAHCQLVMVVDFIHAVYNEDNTMDDSLKDVLRRLAILFCVSTLEQEMAEFLTCSYFSATQALLVKEHLVSMFKSIRPDAVALVDSFGFPEYLLNSALGGEKGDVYQKMVSMVELEPLNQKKVADGYEECIRPLIHKGKDNWIYDKNGVAKL